MTRPRKQTVDYFPHSCKHGMTIFILETKYGDRGYAFWFKLLELLGSSTGHTIDANDDEKFLYLCSYTKNSPEECNEKLDLLAKLNAIDRDLWRRSRAIWSQNFVDRLTPCYGKRTTEIPVKPGLRPDNPADGEFSDRKPSGNPQSKVKERKGKEREGKKREERKRERNSSSRLPPAKSGQGKAPTPPLPPAPPEPPSPPEPPEPPKPPTPPKPPSRPKPPRPRAEAAEIPPAVKVFRETVHRFPPKALYAEIDQVVGREQGALDFWRKVLRSWLLNGYNPMNLAGQLDAFRAKEIPQVRGRRDRPAVYGLPPGQEDRKLDRVKELLRVHAGHPRIVELVAGQAGVGADVVRKALAAMSPIPLPPTPEEKKKAVEPVGDVVGRVIGAVRVGQ